MVAYFAMKSYCIDEMKGKHHGVIELVSLCVWGGGVGKGGKGVIGAVKVNSAYFSCVAIVSITQLDSFFQYFFCYA